MSTNISRNLRSTWRRTATVSAVSAALMLSACADSSEDSASVVLDGRSESVGQQANSANTQVESYADGEMSDGGTASGEVTTEAMVDDSDRTLSPASTVATEAADQPLEVSTGDVVAEEPVVPPVEPVVPEPTENELFFENYGVNPRIVTAEDALSTFAIDVDTGAYTLGRQWLNDGLMPPADSVRVEEYVNYFDQDYAPPLDGPFAVHADGGPTPFLEGDDYRLVRVGVQSMVVDNADRPDAVLTFVVDVSGSMGGELPKVREALTVLVQSLRDTDSVGIVVYGSDSKVILPQTQVADADEILAAIDQLQTNGSTNAEEGLRVGYTEATRAFDADAINRVVLLSDGVANVGATGPDAILETIREASGDGIDLVTVGFGDGTYNDVMMEQLANDGNGFYAFVDNVREAKRLFREDLTGTLLTVARDTKIQVEFHEANVARYRLIGFENRDVADVDFRNDAIDAGEIGAGHSVTALYEIQLAEGVQLNDSDVLATARLRWEDPDTGEVTEMAEPISMGELSATYDETDPHFQLASTVGAYAEVMRNSPFATENNVITHEAVAVEALRLADDHFADSLEATEFAQLTKQAATL